jgi:hypothetical protein
MRLTQANAYARLAEDGRRAAVLAVGGRTAEAANHGAIRTYGLAMNDVGRKPQRDS